jgi:ribosomal protein S12 methylthiotransferase
MKYHLITLGCPKNKVDSDGIEMLLRDATYRPTEIPRDADVLIVNTCGFLEAAKEESIGVLQDLGKRKRKHQLLIAAGCLAQRNGAEVLQRVPKVDGLLGTRRWMDVLELIRQVRGGQGQRRFAQYDVLGDPGVSTGGAGAAAGTPGGANGRAAALLGVPALLDDPQMGYDKATPRPPVPAGSAYLKISDGCNAPCAFCTIPSFKGKLKSRPLDAIVDEAQALVGAGARELVIVAQDTTDYGRDFGAPNSLPQLLSALCNRTDDRLAWVRLMYAYPGHVSDELVEVMARERKIVPYLDMPLQHGDPRTLRRMHRPSRVETVHDHIHKLRAAMPDITLRTTFIVGYPGETEEEFQGLLDFVAAIEFDKVGAFLFSPEPGTPSALLPDQVPDEVKQERYDRLMQVQQPISLRKNQAQVGKLLDVLVEGEGEVEGSGAPLVLGRSYRDAPEIDGLVLIPNIGGAPVGEFLQVHINGAMEYDLVGEVLMNEVFLSKK